MSLGGKQDSNKIQRDKQFDRIMSAWETSHCASQILQRVDSGQRLTSNASKTTRTLTMKAEWWAWIFVVLLCPLACIFGLISKCFDCHVLTKMRRLRQTWAVSHAIDERAEEELLRGIVRTQIVHTYHYEPQEGGGHD